VIVSAAEAVEAEISTNRPATSLSVHGVRGTTAGRNFSVEDEAMDGNSGKVILHLSGTQTNEISNRQQLQDGMVELLRESNAAFAECRKREALFNDEVNRLLKRGGNLKA
jgi:hypothetical protein